MAVAFYPSAKHRVAKLLRSMVAGSICNNHELWSLQNELGIGRTKEACRELRKR